LLGFVVEMELEGCLMVVGLFLPDSGGWRA